MRVVQFLLVAALTTLAACQTTTSEEGVETGRTNSIVQSEIDRRISELRYLHGNELLQSMTRLIALGDSAAPSIRRGAKSEDWLTRSSLAWVMGASSDRRYIPDLRAMLDDPVMGVRYEAASGLVELGDPAGFAVLVDGLSDEDIRNRYKCFESLRRATGQDFGYQHDSEASARQDSVVRWKDWLAGLRASAL
jgi:HEAT repeats